MKCYLIHFLITLSILFPQLSIAQAPNLGSAAGFVIFSSTGAVGNTGISKITGNAGTNSGAITINVNVNGVIHNADSAAGFAALDVQKAYNQLDTTSYTSIHAPSLGHNDTMNAGVYQMTGNTNLDSILTLDGQSNANSVFIFKIAGGIFSTTSSAKVILVNGAQACNVFWNVDGPVNLVSGTVMRGTIIAKSAAIDLASGVVLEGRALTATAGAITATNVLAYLPTGCGSPVLMGPLAPALGSTSCYALFSGNGSVSNSDTTFLSGDVGTNVGLTTGYDSAHVSGSIHPGPDTSTAHCKVDLLNVHTYLLNLPADITLQYPAQLGHSFVLTPHVYLLAAATSLTDTLFLNAAGNANAVFVLRIMGALSTSTHARVMLTNGTQAKNVFWDVEGAVNINDSSDFKGTIICNNGAIHLTTGVTLDGRALTTTGALSTASMSTTMPPGPCGQITPLPVTWLYFNGRAVLKNILLEWGTTREINNGCFNMEKSIDGKEFEAIAIIKAVTQPSAENHYSFTDPEPYPVTYYRVAQVDLSGQKTYSRTIQLSIDPSLVLYHYVTADNLYIRASAATTDNATVLLYSMDGRKVASQNILLTREPGTFRIEKPAQKGIYLLYIESRGLKLYSAKVVVN